jgi:hypothetical protein
MKIGKFNGLTVFAIVFLTFSCHIIEQKNGPLDGSPALWDIKDSIVQIHSYNKNGLADSTFQIWYHFRHGKTDLHTKSLITRVFDGRGKLMEEGYFDYLKKSGTWVPNGRTVQKYDSKGNIVLHVETDIKNSKSRLSRLVKSVYNQKNQEILRFELRRKLELEPDWNIDSALVHADDDLKDINYDTVIVSSTYGRDGNLVMRSYGSPGHPAESAVITTYSRRVREADFCLNADGDTITIYRYESEGDLVRKIREDKRTRLKYETDTVWYRGDKEVRRVNYNNKMHTKQMMVYWYDVKGSEIGRAGYR